MSPLLFAMVDAMLNEERRQGWRLRLWPARRRQWERAVLMLGWWRSTW